MKNIYRFLLFITIICSIFISCKRLSNNKEQQKNTEATRIISLSPAATEIIFAIGAQDKLIARTDYCNYPKEVININSIGGFDGKEISLEKIIVLNPDLVCITEGMHDYMISTLDSLRIKYIILKSSDFNDIYSSIINIGKATGHIKQSENLVASITESLKKIRIPRKRSKVYFEVSSKPYITCGNSSFISKVIEYAGGENIFFSTEESYPVVSEESIIIRNPEFIIIPIYSDNQSKDKIKAEIKQRRGWSEINAIKDENIIFVDSNIFERPGPRIAEAVYDLNQKLYE